MKEQLIALVQKGNCQAAWLACELQVKEAIPHILKQHFRKSDFWSMYDRYIGHFSSEDVFPHLDFAKPSEELFQILAKFKGNMFSHMYLKNFIGHPNKELVYHAISTIVEIQAVSNAQIFKLIEQSNLDIWEKTVCMTTLGKPLKKIVNFIENNLSTCPQVEQRLAEIGVKALSYITNKKIRENIILNSGNIDLIFSLKLPISIILKKANFKGGDVYKYRNKLYEAIASNNSKTRYSAFCLLARHWYHTEYYPYFIKGLSDTDKDTQNICLSSLLNYHQKKGNT